MQKDLQNRFTASGNMIRNGVITPVTIIGTYPEDRPDPVYCTVIHDFIPATIEAEQSEGVIDPEQEGDSSDTLGEENESIKEAIELTGITPFGETFWIPRFESRTSSFNNRDAGPTISLDGIAKLFIQGGLE